MNTQRDLHDSLMPGLARVVAVEDSQVWLVAEQPAACGSCATRNACGSGSSKPAASWRVPSALGPGQTPLALGDSVHIGVDRNALTRAALTVYALPLATLLLAAITMQGAGDAMAIMAALGGLLVGIAGARVLARRWRNTLAPVVLGRAQHSAGSPCATGSTAQVRAVAIPVIHQGSR